MRVVREPTGTFGRVTELPAFTMMIHTFHTLRRQNLLHYQPASCISCQAFVNITKTRALVYANMHHQRHRPCIRRMQFITSPLKWRSLRATINERKIAFPLPTSRNRRNKRRTNYEAHLPESEHLQYTAPPFRRQTALTGGVDVQLLVVFPWCW